MAKTFTTADCKQYLITAYPDTEKKDWKRISKYKENNEWVRQFSHSTIGVVFVQEKNETLTLIQPASLNNSIEDTIKNTENHQSVSHNEEQDTNEILSQLANTSRLHNVNDLVELEQTHQYVQRTFTDLEKNSALQILALADHGLELEDIIETEIYQQYHYALPSIFSFNFPKDTYENEEINRPKSGIISSIFRPNGDSFCFNFFSKNHNDGYPDMIYTDLIRPLLPKHMDTNDETILEVIDNTHQHSIEDVLKTLLKIGFSYEKQDCFFEKEFDAIEVVPVLMEGVEESVRDIIDENIVNMYGVSYDDDNSAMVHHFPSSMGQTEQQMISRINASFSHLGIDLGGVHFADENGIPREHIILDIDKYIIQFKDQVLNQNTTNFDEMYQFFNAFSQQHKGLKIQELYDSFNTFLLPENINQMVFKSAHILHKNHYPLLSNTLSQATKPEIAQCVYYLLQNHEYDVALGIVKQYKIKQEDFGIINTTTINSNSLQGLIAQCIQENNHSRGKTATLVLNEMFNILFIQKQEEKNTFEASKYKTKF